MKLLFDDRDLSTSVEVTTSCILSSRPERSGAERSLPLFYKKYPLFLPLNQGEKLVPSHKIGEGKEGV